MPFIPDPLPGDAASALPTESGVSHFIPDPTAFGAPSGPETQAPERPPGPGTRQATLPTANLAPWLADKLSELGIAGSSITKGMGGPIGSMALPAIATAIAPEIGVPALIASGILGGMSGKMTENVLRGQPSLSDPLDIAAQGAFGGVSGAVSLPARGAQLAVQGAARNAGAMSDIGASALASNAAVDTQPLQAVTNQLTNVARMGTPAGSKGQEAQILIDTLSPHIQGPVIPLRDFNALRDLVGSMAEKGNRVARQVYAQMSDILRTGAGPEGRNLAQSIGEQQALKALTPDLGVQNLASAGATAATLAAGHRSPATTIIGGILGGAVPYLGRAGADMGQEAAYLGYPAFNPYIAAPVNAGLQSVWDRFNPQR